MENKKGLIALVVALVAVVGAAGVGYTFLGKQVSVMPGIALPSESATGATDATTAADSATTNASSSEDASVQDAEGAQTGTTPEDADTPDAESSEVSQMSDAAGAQESSSADATEAGSMTLPDFSVQDRQGNTVSLSSVHGKPAIVGFWATWCPPCNAEAPAIQKLYETYGDRINFMMIDAGGDGRDTTDVVEDWIAEGGYTYPIYLDPLGTASSAAQIYYLPTTFVLDADGNVLTAFSGALDEESGTNLMEQLLEYTAQS